jgi:hypothetical protein
MVSAKQEDLTKIRKTSIAADKQNRAKLPFSEQAGMQEKKQAGMQEKKGKTPLQ